MNNKIFKERLEEILVDYRTDLTQQMGFIIGGKHRLGIGEADKMLLETSIESLITLIEDYTKAIVGGEEDGYELGVISGEKYARRLRNLFRQTIIKSSKTILRGESDDA